jgi:hypothetical protein
LAASLTRIINIRSRPHQHSHSRIYAKPHEKLYATGAHWTSDYADPDSFELRGNNQNYDAASSAAGCRQRDAVQRERTRGRNANFHVRSDRYSKSKCELVGERDSRRQRYIWNYQRIRRLHRASEPAESEHVCDHSDIGRRFQRQRDQQRHAVESYTDD